MASSSRDQILPIGLPQGSQRSETTGENLRSGSAPNPPANSGNTPAPNPISPPPPAAGTPPAPTPKPGPADKPKPPAPGQGPSVQHRFLTPTEWARVAHGLGAIREGEEHQVVHPTCWYWPPKGMPDGLYRDAVTERTKYAIGFQLVGALHWFLLILQVTLGAVLTALGSLPQRQATPITVLAAVNTVGAGLLGLLHNSGLPDRYRMDKAQFVLVEDFIKEILDTGIVEADQSVEDVLNECYTRLQYAKATVLANKPEVYSPAAGGGQDKTITSPEPTMHLQLVRR